MAQVWQERLDTLRAVILADIARGDYYGLVLTVGRGGEKVFEEALGAQDGAGERPLRLDNVFSIFSTTKAFTNILILKAIEEGRFALTTKVRDVLPEFTGKPREEATFYHLLTHTAGMPGVWTPKPGMYLDRLSDLYEATTEAVHGVVEPGSRCDYSPLVNHVLMGMALVRTDPKGRDYQTLLHEDLFAPLRMDSTSMGLRADLKDRHVRPDMRGTVPIKHLSRNIEGDHALFEDPATEAPHVGCASTSGDLYRFAEMLRRGGELDGVRILSPRMIKVARQVHTGEMPNELYKAAHLRAGWQVAPAYMGLGFNVRGTAIVNHQLGTLTSPETYGNYGAGSTLFWVDPELDVSFAATSAGVMTQTANIDRFQKLSDLVVSAMV
ncbi:beta-lactamase family protein [Altererythrobacter sp. CC-YST694]|uniref:serine hydrolase domain-containing protein n=1 Tax=Altererythrobacter sp. CC-YST694 TaxID=2755038 RepID=UPI001D007D48|nr:serine hydrolase domain-containing protein [Altererythrobacter sp. CC-YST694]MCB5425489.1 beta-lactamase family protein [Altererythrobacter sp. CC-YST694]